MYQIKVYFYENVIDVYKTMVIDASSLEDFNKKLESLMIDIDIKARKKVLNFVAQNTIYPKNGKIIGGKRDENI